MTPERQKDQPIVAEFELQLASTLPPQLALSAVLNPVAQSLLIPFTTVRRDGDLIRTRTGGRWLGFNDDMRVLVDQHNPNSLRIEKLGEVITGRVRITALPAGSGSIVRWQQDIRITLLPSFADPLVAMSAEAGYGYILGKLLRRAEGR